MDIQQRIDELMKQNNIDTYITLLRKIFKCSVRDESKTDVQWATNQKSNFTNMLKGKRPFGTCFTHFYGQYNKRPTL